MAQRQAPQVPGEVIEEEQRQAEQQAAGEPVIMSAEQFAALMARVNALEARPAAPVRQAVAEANLPDQSEVDCNAIKTSVLTKQGWVVPPTLGSNPAAPKL